jgi:hypothetical protein
VRAWSRFVMALMVRHPEGVQELTDVARQSAREFEEDFRTNYDQYRLPSDPETFDEYKKGMKLGQAYEAEIAIRLLERLMDICPR